MPPALSGGLIFKVYMVSKVLAIVRVFSRRLVFLLPLTVCLYGPTILYGSLAYAPLMCAAIVSYIIACSIRELFKKED